MFILCGMCPKEGHNYSIRELLLSSLHDRRCQADLCFLFKVINGYVQDPELLSLISFNVNTRRTRNTEIFNIPFHSTNYGQNEPITRILRTANEHSNNLELFGISTAAFKKSFERF
ncbi:unnamed protein product [Diabrotica balteata]|uniref:Uncharacterized protein n=1 Tax=Diabrotica balteata TaxID=107213 RepID=A0A9N9T5T5_DIABA|nr:unnamed protein product [Diabrotica balteata]